VIYYLLLEGLFDRFILGGVGIEDSFFVFLLMLSSRLEIPQREHAMQQSRISMFDM
jgi:hypothetical protein